MSDFPTDCLCGGRGRLADAPCPRCTIPAAPPADEQEGSRAMYQTLRGRKVHKRARAITAKLARGQRVDMRDIKDPEVFREVLHLRLRGER